MSHKTEGRADESHHDSEPTLNTESISGPWAGSSQRRFMDSRNNRASARCVTSKQTIQETKQRAEGEPAQAERVEHTHRPQIKTKPNGKEGKNRDDQIANATNRRVREGSRTVVRQLPPGKPIVDEPVRGRIEITAHTHG